MRRRPDDRTPKTTGASDGALAEARAAHVGLIRYELRVAAGADALDALERRLFPDDKGEAPPSRAPGIVRLRRALDTLRAGAAPDAPLEQFADDLRFLMLFDATSPALDDQALGRLLSDVRPPKRNRTARRRAVRPVPPPEDG